jgi:hypothetical protein
MKKLLGLVLSAVLSSTAMAEEPIIIIGASYANASTPINDNLDAPLGGVSVALGSFLSLGNGLVRNRSLSGHVINEAQAGATSFDRIACNPACTPDVMWQGYDKQFTKALKRVTALDPVTGDIAVLNAKYVVIALPNDCLHSDAFGVPQADTSPCTTQQMNESADRLIAVGQRAVDLGMTPIYPIPPTYEQLDLELFYTMFGLNWAADKANYDELVSIRTARIEAELPEAAQVNAWKRFVHIGDGIHPDQKSVIFAAKKIARFIKKQDRRDAKND